MERKSLETAALRYTYLRGWLYVPAGALFILSALANWRVGPLQADWTFPLAVLVLGAGSLPILRYYNVHFGRLRMSLRHQWHAAVGIGAGAVLIFAGSLLLRSRASWSLDLPVNPVMVTIALYMLGLYALTVGIKAHHVAIWGAVLVAGALPVWNGSDPSNIGLLLTGIAVIATAPFDHRLLVRAFAAVPPAST